ncbi:MoaD/ThiS family protein [Desulfosporosinus sp. BICA1-9]|uniref:MoaD/ThiS family protein n=1 Tax=Desulfosporosinus sp. BICA1-9 TaxID=1531958 RepID=UPI000AA0F0C2|nr:MoaD/ThiS family protein [Desulfosporosinus sp. BICA1-9]HBW36017.1 molybdopterin synthase sulfur carrier subunit [Desulfosporosinus sp.]
MNNIIVRLPTSIAHLTGDNKVVECAAHSIVECIQDLDVRFTGLKDILCDLDGNVSDLFFVFLNGENRAYLQGLKTTLQAGDELTIIPAAAGG